MYKILEIFHITRNFFSRNFLPFCYGGVIHDMVLTPTICCNMLLSDLSSFSVDSKYTSSIVLSQINVVIFSATA